MHRITFSVQGSGKEPYEVTFIPKDAGRFIATCNCKAGIFGPYCKHRVGILTNDAKVTKDLDPDDLTTVRGWILGGPVEEFLDGFAQLEEEIGSRQRKLNKMKKKLAGILKGEF